MWSHSRNLRSDVIIIFASLAREGKKWRLLHSFNKPWTAHKFTKFNVYLTCHVISQSAFSRRESNFGENNVYFEINFREKKLFKYVHVQMALPVPKAVKKKKK